MATGAAGALVAAAGARVAAAGALVTAAGASVAEPVLCSELFVQPVKTRPASAQADKNEIKRFKQDSPSAQCFFVASAARTRLPRERGGRTYENLPTVVPHMAERPSLETVPPGMRRALLSLEWAERAIFLMTGLLLFAGALALLKRSVELLVPMFVGDSGSALAYASQFLDVVLLVLMLIELAYTVMLSLRGSVLQAEPFLIVGLIAVIRRMLVITVGEHVPNGASPTASANELAILTGVVLALVASIYVLRLHPKRDLSSHAFNDDDRQPPLAGPFRRPTQPPDRSA